MPPLRRLALFCFALALLAISAIATPSPAVAQLPEVVVGDSLVEIRLSDGTVLVGRVVLVDRERDRVVVQTPGGARIEVEGAQIRSVRPAGRREAAPPVDDGGWGDDPNPTRLFFAPTGRSLPAGQGAFGAFELFFPYLSWGIFDRVSITAGIPVFPGEDVAEFLFVIPKVQIVDEARAQVAVGLLGIWADEEFDSTRGIAFITGTFGGPDRALTAGFGVPVIPSDEADAVGEPVLLMLGGEHRGGRRVKLITENYFSPGESEAIFSVGLRFFSERLSAEFGVGGIAGGEDPACCVPLVNFSYVFGGPRR